MPYPPGTVAAPVPKLLQDAVPTVTFDHYRFWTGKLAHRARVFVWHLRHPESWDPQPCSVPAVPVMACGGVTMRERRSCIIVYGGYRWYTGSPARLLRRADDSTWER
ncbi:hypothetical protein B0I35DRAFT_59882 [Stachybotrys elegans]|uniref:Uncharacterized protein n=1 Tax=Stachybotrys elegans TaxID=80388 RepID=A0A8K0SL77_9HYPO|nr:hypothetical protein B0I35DRAFT_59882 [Stachybotrys elegans]